MSLKIANEILISSDPSVLAWDNKLFVGFDDGSIKSFDDHLNAVKSWPAHAVQIFALAAGKGRVYSTSNDGGIKIWSSEGERIGELRTTEADVGVLHLYGNELYAGSEDGNVVVYENDKEKAIYSLLEEVKDLKYRAPFLYTVRDLYVTVTEIQPGQSKNRYTLRHTIEGRAPLQFLEGRLLIIARDGNTLQLHDGAIATGFKKLHEVKVSDMILTSLSVSGPCVWTGGWDGKLRRWTLLGEQLEAAGSLDLGGCINSLLAISPDTVIVGVAGGKLLRVVAA